MPENARGKIRRHWNVVLSFLIGMAFGISVLALAFFSTRAEIAAHLLRYGIQATAHPDLGEDLVWLFCGIVIGGTVAGLAWWRDSRARTIGLDEADVLNRLFATPERRPLGGPNRPGENSGGFPPVSD